MKESEKILKIVRLLEETYPDAECSLNFQNAYELMVATVLSAQCTDKRVNEVTPALFKKYPDIKSLAQAKETQLQSIIASTGFFRQKAKNLKRAAEMIVEEHQSQIPQKLEELVKLPGVGRKTANVILGNAFHKAEGVVVDTHVGRLSRRLGLTKNQDATKVENDLNRKVPEKFWIDFPHLLIHHGRAICMARSPKCLECVLLWLCPRVGLPKLPKMPKSFQMTEKGDLKAEKKTKSSRAIRAKSR